MNKLVAFRQSYRHLVALNVQARCKGLFDLSSFSLHDISRIVNLTELCCLVGAGTVSLGNYDCKTIEQNASAFDRNNELLFPQGQRTANGLKYKSILPPPNVTGNLHLGHVLMLTVCDVLCRWNHLNGYDVELIPGTDHAGIATQVVVEQQLKKTTGQSRFDIGKAAFLDEIYKWKSEKGLDSKFFVLVLRPIETLHFSKSSFIVKCRQQHQK